MTRSLPSRGEMSMSSIMPAVSCSGAVNVREVANGPATATSGRCNLETARVSRSVGEQAALKRLNQHLARNARHRYPYPEGVGNRVAGNIEPVAEWCDLNESLALILVPTLVQECPEGRWDTIIGCGITSSPGSVAWTSSSVAPRRIPWCRTTRYIPIPASRIQDHRLCIVLSLLVSAVLAMRADLRTDTRRTNTMDSMACGWRQQPRMEEKDACRRAHPNPGKTLPPQEEVWRNETSTCREDPFTRPGVTMATVSLPNRHLRLQPLPVHSEPAYVDHEPGARPGHTTPYE